MDNSKEILNENHTKKENYPSEYNIEKNKLNNFKYCLNSVKSMDYMNYLSALLFPNYAKSHAFSVLALNVELGTLRHSIEINGGTAGIYRLQFWKDTIDTIYRIKKGPIPRQPTAEALKQFLLYRQTNINYLYQLIFSRQSTLGDKGFKTIKELEYYGESTIGSVIKLLCEDSLGKATGIINHIRSIIPMLKKNIVLLPQDLMILHNFTSDQLYTGKNSSGSVNVIKDLVDLSEFHLSEARKIKKDIEKKYRIAFVGSSLSCDYHIKGLKKNKYRFDYPALQSNEPLAAFKVGKLKLFNSY
ncbi:NADH dehydrogenase (ubiquinone) complex I, assembly factor 6 [Strongyloides ratti]|uniref:NADH dehydrogenase (Ubiquinone) complex I, assembly factor 6 n=1 Tax=Strongyloides ratti TaxID=34506 RepID=A0A090MY18_STRRB|nr:NADH dehydrogenase (ubiquinone) complex I, assembly factor 6 [Strongyloides ratti]CEF66409.1 NADH dehydrogenase (ubiquinone) complex I, assembly factor 6 [Strongyloides ratti]